MRSRRGSILTLVELLVVALIIMAVFVAVSRSYLEKSRTEGVTGPKERAESVECLTNLRQIRSAIAMREETTEAPAKSLEDLETFGVSGAILKCPVSGNKYSYDPVSQKVWCTTPGHEGY